MKKITLRHIILTVANIVVLLILIFLGLMLHLGIAKMLTFVLIGELIFLILSLMVYYLSIIARSISKIADNSAKED